MRERSRVSSRAASAKRINGRRTSKANFVVTFSCFRRSHQRKTYTTRGGDADQQKQRRQQSKRQQISLLPAPRRRRRRKEHTVFLVPVFRGLDSRNKASSKAARNRHRLLLPQQLLHPMHSCHQHHQHRQHGRNHHDGDDGSSSPPDSPHLLVTGHLPCRVFPREPQEEDRVSPHPPLLSPLIFALYLHHHHRDGDPGLPNSKKTGANN